MLGRVPPSLCVRGGMLRRELASHGERCTTLVCTLPTHHGVYAIFPGTPRSSTDPAHGYPRTDGVTAVQALEHALVELDIPESGVTVRRCY